MGGVDDKDWIDLELINWMVKGEHCGVHQADSLSEGRKEGGGWEEVFI